MTGQAKEHKNEWVAVADTLAAESGLSVVAVVGEQAEPVAVSNQNSVCEVLLTATEFAPRCAEFCGRAVTDAAAEGKTIYRQCHAGLHYAATPVDSQSSEKMAVITGRAFTRTEEYMAATDRAITGDWQAFSSGELFENALLAGSVREIEQLAGRIESLSDKERALLLNIGSRVEAAGVAHSQDGGIVDEQGKLNQRIEEFLKGDQPKLDALTVSERRSGERRAAEIEEVSAWRALFGTLLEKNYKSALSSVLEFLSDRYGVSEVAWLEHRGEALETVLATGSFAGQQIQVKIKSDDERLLNVVRKETSLQLKERVSTEGKGEETKTIQMFPIAVGGEVRSALIVGDEIKDKAVKTKIAKFSQSVASELEILRLRDEIERQSWLTKTVYRLNELFKRIDAEDFWIRLAEILTELMQAERGSLLAFDENSKSLVVKAAIGNRSDVIVAPSEIPVGERIANNVLNSGRPLVVKDLKDAGVPPAPAEWKYKTRSFISYPIKIGGRKVGVLNVTDKVDGTSYNELDLELLHVIAPQIAIALDRTSLKYRAGEFEQLSITDPLTGLVNRRYLEERLSEEISRSQRHGYPMSFMMIDVDEFKSYNDSYSHPEGDKALQLVGQCLKATLRGADVAARYGGEEFSILLPQTTLNEARTIAERIRERVEDTRFPNRQVTVSIGVAVCSADNCDSKRLVAAADKALYQAKSKGKNNVQIFGEGGEGKAS